MSNDTITLTDDQALEILQDIPGVCKVVADVEAYQAALEHLKTAEPSTSFNHPETSQPIASKQSYRGRFMAGKEKEYAATEETYQEIYGSPSNGHLMGIRQCRKFAEFAREKNTGQVKVFASACRDRWCPMCGAQKAAYAQEQTQEYIKGLKLPRFLTLTLQNDGADLKHQIEFLTSSFRTLRQRSFWKKNVTGGVWFLQVKRGKNSGCWHPHLHMLIDGNRMEQGRLSELWEQVTFGSPVIDIRAVYNAEEVSKYVARYSSRPAMLGDMPLADRVEVVESLFRKRMCGTFGNGKAVTLTPPKVEMDGEWSTIGFYDKVVRAARTCADAKAVLRAYFNDSALSESAFESYTGHPVVVVMEPYVPPKPAQMLLDFYNTA